MDPSFYLRFVGAALLTGLVVFAGALLTGSGIPGTIDGLFLIGMLAAVVSVLFTRPSVFRKRSIRRAQEERANEEDSSNGDEADRQPPENGREPPEDGQEPAPAHAGGRGRADRQLGDPAESDPARKIRIGLGLIAYAGVLLTLSAILHIFAL